MFDASAVVAGLDVHKASTRVVAVQGDRLVWEGTWRAIRCSSRLRLAASV